MSEEKEQLIDWYSIITLMEKTLLVVIAFLTTYAVIVEIFVVLSERAVKLTDLLLLFIYSVLKLIKWIEYGRLLGFGQYWMDSVIN